MIIGLPINEKEKKLDERARDIITQLENNVAIINELKQKEDVQDFNKLLKKQVQLEKEFYKINKIIGYKIIDLNSRMSKINYLKCDHIWIVILADYNRKTGEYTLYYGCPKCGLNDRIIYDKRSPLYFSNDFIFDELIYEIVSGDLDKNYLKNGILTDIYCDFDLIKALYNNIKKDNPNIDDESMIEHLKEKLKDIENNIKTDEDKRGLAKNLNLSLKRGVFNKGFNSWSKEDIIIK